jgi:serine phosphatase RsbU (regulator of sigma subunit)/ligand-binding sensor domain-containing protein
LKLLKKTLLLLLIFVVSAVKAQYNGFPIRNYAQKEYNAFMQNWFCVQDKRGVLYFGNSSNVLEYDGKNWRKIPIVKGVAVRSLYINSQGTIFVGAVGDFGYLAPQKNGDLVYQSLSSLLPAEQRTFADIWNIQELNGAILFQASENMFVYEKNKLKIVAPTKNTFASISFKINNALFLRERNIGLMKWDGKSLSLVPEGASLQNTAVVGMVNYPSQQSKNILTLSVDEGFSYIDTEKGKISKFNSPSESELNSIGVLGMEWFNDSTLILNTRSGVYFLDNKLNIIRTITKEDGLLDESVADMFFDSQKELWLSTNNGISKVSVNSPFYYYNATVGLNGNIEAITTMGNSIYVGTTSGMYVADLGTNNRSGAPQKLVFNQVEGTYFETWNFRIAENRIYGATSDGVFEIVNKKAVRVTKTYSNTIYMHNNKRMFVGEKDGLRILDKNGNNWNEAHYFNIPTSDIMNLALAEVNAKGESIVWFSTRNSGVYKMNIQPDYNYSLTHFDTTNGLPNEQVFIFKKNQEVYFNGNHFVYQFDKNASNPKEKFVVVNKNASAYNHNAEPIPLLNNENSNTQKTVKAIAAIEDQGYTYYQSDSSILWIGLTDVLTRYDATVQKEYSPVYTTLIRKVTIGNDSTVFAGTFSVPFENSYVVVDTQTTNFIPEIAYKCNTLDFNYSATFYDREDKINFSYKLIGFDTAWSEWSSLNYKQYTNLYEGEYSFEVKAKNIYGHESKVAKYSFVVLPPWYRSFIAYIIYFIAFIILMIIIVRISVWRLRKAKIKLERIVDERTAEVVKQKEELQQKSEIIEVAYNDIKSSINYAKRIQEAILPLNDEIKKYFPESFILFKPRDVVSGDFYWFMKTAGKTVIACVDCTGHGVPGAFMSMIGNTLLNEIVVEKNITQPNQILNLLHERVRQSLKQDMENTETRDGMDIAICVIDDTKELLQYAGANRSLVIIRDHSLIELKADKQPIGGDQMEQDRVFKNNEFKLHKSDTIYMTTDGFADQFGGEKGKKFMVKRLHQLLIDLNGKKMDEQRTLLKNTIEHWQGNLEQVDDILVIGINIS